MGYGSYTRTETHVDIAAHPGYRARLQPRHGFADTRPWLDVVAWRIFEHSPGRPIIVDTTGVRLLVSDYAEDIQILLPGQEPPTIN